MVLVNVLFTSGIIRIPFQPWENQCECGIGKENKGVVQLFEDTQETKTTTILDGKTALLKEPSLKIPICMGTLISKDYILTTKFCFGKHDNKGEFKQTGSIFENNHIE